MKYKTIESRLKTNKSKDYLWNKINTLKKIMKLEGFKKFKIKKISGNNYEVTTPKRFFFLTFIPKLGINLTFINKNDDSSLAWFEIKGEKNCTLIHGNSVRIDDDNGKWYRNNLKSAKKHMLDELKEIAK
ncbi:MAG: hypothetical protein QF567_03045 [Candidatus Pacearchaeota archaeon]|jgi:hypothetical protein|nr:hypothetical protein [Candidatus Pacearchaeota archaeon]|tara:strand:- start:1301 stop:1690 length:390 start_codon:yes stop_codon:yes gene_type:complete